MRLQKKFNKYTLIYLGSVFALALPSLNLLFDVHCNFYSDYLTCSNNPSADFLSRVNFTYLLLAFGLLSFSYYKIIKIGLKIPVKVVGAILFLFFITVPFGSTDIFYYRGVAKGEIEQNINPYKGGFKKDLNFLVINGTPVDKPAMYPPSWLQLNKIIYTISPNNEYLSMYAYKLSATIVTLLIYLVIRKGHSENIAQLFILNPLVLFEFSTNAHLDVYLSFFVAISIVLFYKEHFAKSALALFAASMIKFTAAIPLAFYHIYDFLSHRSLKGKLKSFGTFIATTTLGALFVVLNYKPYWFGPKTLEGISKQSETPFNSIFERLVYTKYNPFLYIAEGKYNYSSFRNVWLILMVIGFSLIGIHILRNLKIKNIKDMKKIAFCNFSISKESVVFYSGMLLYVFATLTMRLFFPWYIIWSLVFFIFAKFKYKFEVIASQTLILAIYYPTVYLMGHFTVTTGVKVYHNMVCAEAILIFFVLYLIVKSKVKILA